ncbi:hypothetical protein ABEY65_27980 [Priestia aryabhattai]|uniref:hypothetical protein n=1 Tax=Priestia aryabhattai TaxID=412384 RepID=UPI003D2D48E1
MTTEKKKKSIFKRWWFWVLVVVIVGAIASGGSGDDTDKITDEGSTSQTAKSDKGIASETASAPKKEEAPKAEPTKVWEGNGVTIYFKEATDEGLKFLVENTNDKSVTIQADSVALNGFSANDIMMSDDISPNSKGYAIAGTSDLADAGTPEKVSGNLTVIDSNTFDTIANAQFTDVPVNK